MSGTAPKRLKTAGGAKKKPKNSSTVTQVNRTFGKLPYRMPKTVVGFPKLLTMSHRWVDQISVVANPSQIAGYRWSTNGMFKPDQTVVGNTRQPFYFDQMTPIYTNYVVTQSRIKITCQHTTTSPNGYLVALNINDDETIIATQVKDLCEHTSSKTYVGGHSGTEPIVMYSSWNAKQTFSGNIQDNTLLQGTSTSNPTQQCFYTFIFQSWGTQPTIGVDLAVELEYTCVWKELKDIASS